MQLKKIELPFKTAKSVLALGAQTKNTISFLKDGFVYISPIHPDLSNPQDFLSFKKDTGYFLKKHPKIIACDLHPEYQSTKYAQHLLPTIYRLSSIQHHHAHIASCMLENSLKNQRVIGVAFDGTGLGDDNKIWGAEFLICDYKNFIRIAHLKETPLLGLDMAILEPWRLAALWLYLAYKERFFNLGVDFVKKIDKKKWRVLKRMYTTGFNSPLASSMGRLFDAAASLILVKDKVSFEAELAIELEREATKYKLAATSYNFKIMQDKGNYILDPTPVFKEIILDLKHKEAKEKIACRFHLTVAEMVKKVCLVLRKKTRINTVVLSGGVFQNNLLLRMSLGLLYRQNFQVLTHKKLSCNDSGISLGQAIVALFKRG